MLETPIMAPGCQFLSLPAEIRHIIFIALFQPLKTIHITPCPPSTPVEDEDSSTSWPADQESLAVTRHDLHPQLLATCRQLHAEGLPFLYSQRHFDLTARESLKLFLHNIGSQTFSSIHQIVLEWDTLQDFAWSIPKPGYDVALSGLEIIEMATWRNRHLKTTGTRWRNVKSYERMICQAAADIIQKHAKLKIVVEEQFVRKGSITLSMPTGRVADGNEELKSTESGPLRVKWRFLSSTKYQKRNETSIDIHGDLKILKATQDEASDGGFHLPMMDPF